MSDATAARLKSASEALATITDAHAKAVKAETDAGGSLLTYKKQRDTMGVNMIGASSALALLSSITETEAKYAAAQKERAALADLLQSFTASHAAADAAHSVALTHDARPEAYAAIEKSLLDLAAFATALRGVIDLAQRAGIPVSGDGWSTKFVAVLADHGVGPRFTAK